MSYSPLEKVVRDLLAERFPGTGISQVSIRSDVDSDGDRILRIVVVFDAKAESLDRDSVVGLVRLLRPKLAEIETEDFPILSFVSKGDASRLQREPA